MKIMKLEVPITDYYGEGVFFKLFYFQIEESSPSKAEVIEKITKVHEENLQYPDYFNEEGESVEILKLVDDWQTIDNGIVMTNVFVQHPKFGMQPVTWSKVNIL